MKNILFITALLAATVFFTRCTSIDDLQQDPNRPTQVNPELLFTQIQILAFRNANITSGLASRYLTNTDGVNSNQYYNWQRGSFDGYLNVKQVSKMIGESQRHKQDIYAVLAPFFNSYFIVELTNTFGDVPYSQAIRANENIMAPTYDSQKQIFLKVLDDLKQSSVALASHPGTLSGDVIYGGDKNKWRKLINSYYLRVLLSLSNRVEDSDLNLKGRFREVVDHPEDFPLMTSNADSGQLVYVNSKENQYPSYNDNSLQTAHYMEEGFVSKLQAYRDPRLFVFADQKPKGSHLEATDFSAYGGLKGSGTLSENASKAVSGEASRIASRYYSDPINEPSVLMGYWELQFILAEATSRGWINGNVEDFYNQGIRASFEYFKVELGDYLAHPQVRLNNSKALEQILTQKYFASFMNSGWQMFYEQRRTGWPQFDVSGGGILNGGRVPKRWMYPVGESTNNPVHLSEAVSRQYPEGDDINGRMWLLN